MSFGAPRGEAFTVSGWEPRFRATAIRERDPEQARALYEEGLAADPQSPWANYDLACWHALYGSAETARALLERAIEHGGDEVRAQAREDPDLASVRDGEAPA
jgi:Flp pilus assembly protein TadD